ncbi:murein biosynthesis integral membrane protein MurJ [Devosia sp. XJ19-1]|uniref:Probable lipid II flippase MurJ n=1 Tax=Devosia ureilytica TaxID=2952754 RepID=A0A9Q4FSB8_9HYPH|nr:murein biosynthesis integral membrane protein MurJ [Devosia ureilytica]MCP8882973.1 murein biosynthesis integral membrane protein MurJ [Devosia ureilytica]MCP8886659.1 murein biosynthesis integral membrane protein MurJ [Devosia ureilytica]
MSLFRNFVSVGSLTLLSRIAGFVRDALMAAVLGTGPAADAFFAAFRFPNLFRRLFAEGAFNTAFVPMFSGALEREGEEGAKLLAARIMSWLVVMLVITTILAEIFMPQIMLAFVPGFVGDAEKFELTVLLTRIMFPYLACMSLMAAYGAILNTLGRFFAAAFAPVLLNLVNIAMLIPLATFWLKSPEEATIWVALATMGGGVAQLVLVWAAIERSGFRPAFRLPRLDAEVRRFWVLAVPAILAGGITQINIFVGTIIASGAANAIAVLSYADRLYQLPLGIIGIAIGTVLLPELSRHLKGGRAAEARQSQDQALFVAMLLTMPAAVALMALAEPIVRVLFERGAFDALATQQTAEALIAFSAGLPAYVLIRVLQPGFFAREDTLTPTIFAGISVAANIAISLWLFPSLVHVGIAIATAASSWLNVVLLAGTLALRRHFALTAQQWRGQLAIVLISASMGVALWLLADQGAAHLASGVPLWRQAGVLAALVLFGFVSYFTLAHITGTQRLGQLLRRLRRR